MHRLFHIVRSLLSTLLIASLPIAADDPPAKPEPKESMKALMLEDAKRKAAEAAAKAPTAGAPAKSETEKETAASGSPVTTAPATAAPPTTADQKTAMATANATAAAQPAAILPKVEVTKARITVLDVQLAEQQRQIAREEKLAKPTELDKALNGSKVSNALSILGGQSADYRAGLAQERVDMMKEESDLIEAIAHTKDKKEKAELQKELDELRSYRRELEKSRR
jgi:hypothetical protein